jgi:hypothetical protein
MQVDSAFWGFCTPLIILRYRMWPATISFFRTEFHDLTSESHYKRENWFLRKVSEAIFCRCIYADAPLTSL